MIVGIGQGYWSATLAAAREGDGAPRDARPALPAAARAARSWTRRPGQVEETHAGSAAAHRAQGPGELGDHRRRDGRGDERRARHGACGVGRGATYSIAGKTGTAQVFTVGQTEKYNEKDVAERLRDHALFVAFAPAEAPKIAIAVLVENGGYGSLGGGADRARDLRRLPATRRPA